MSYLDRLKVRISQDAPNAGATKVSKGAFVPFVATLSAPLRQISAANDLITDPAAEGRRQGLLAMLAENPEARYAVLTDTHTDPDAILLALAIRGRATCELRIPRDRYDPFLLLDLIEHHGATVH